ncbi:MAG: phosphotransferase family protein [Halobacteriaceae archaeon]
MPAPVPEPVLAAAVPEASVVVREVLETRATNGACVLTTLEAPPRVLKYTHTAGWRLHKEATVLEALDDVDGVPVPPVRAVGTADDWTYLLTEEASGTPLSDTSPDDSGPILAAIGEVLAVLHAQITRHRPGTIDPTADSLALTDSPTTWSGVLEDLLAAERDILADTAFAESVDHAQTVLDRVGDRIAPRSSPALLYCDANPRNVLIAEGTVSALLDWEYAKVGDPVFDLITAEHRLIDTGPFDPEARTSLYAGYRRRRSLPDDVRWRRRIYRVLLPLGEMVSRCGGADADLEAAAADDDPAARALRATVRDRIDALED